MWTILTEVDNMIFLKKCFLWFRSVFFWLYHGYSFHKIQSNSLNFGMRKYVCFHTNSLFFQCKLQNVGWCEQTTILHYLSILEVANIPDAIVLLSGHFPRTAFWDIGDRSTQPVPTNDKHILLYNDAQKYAHKFNIRYLKWLDGRPSSVWREKKDWLQGSCE